MTDFAMLMCDRQSVAGHWGRRSGRDAATPRIQAVLQGQDYVMPLRSGGMDSHGVHACMVDVVSCVNSVRPLCSDTKEKLQGHCAAE